MKFSLKGKSQGTKAYGLTYPKGKPVVSTPALTSVFGDDDEDDEDDVDAAVLAGGRKAVEAERAAAALQRQWAANAASEAAAKAQAAALAQDPTVYDYDGQYESMRAQLDEHDKRKRLKQSIRGKPRYVGRLLEEAQERERERELSEQRRAIKELEAAEAADDAPAEAFITPAYRRKLAELEDWKAKKAARDAERDARGANARGMGAFYSNLLRTKVGEASPEPEPVAPASTASTSAASTASSRESTPAEEGPTSTGSRDQACEASPTQAAPEERKRSQREGSDGGERAARPSPHKRARSRSRSRESSQERYEREQRERASRMLEEAERKRRQRDAEAAKRRSEVASNATSLSSTDLEAMKARFLARKKAAAAASSSTD